MKRPWDGVEVTHRKKDADLPEGFEVLKSWPSSLAVLKSNEVRVMLLLAEMCLIEAEDGPKGAEELRKRANTIALITGADAPNVRVKEEDRLPDEIAGQPPEKWLLSAVKIAEPLGKGSVDQRRYTLARLYEVFRWWT